GSKCYPIDFTRKIMCIAYVIVDVVICYVAFQNDATWSICAPLLIFQGKLFTVRVIGPSHKLIRNTAVKIIVRSVQVLHIIGNESVEVDAVRTRSIQRNRSLRGGRFFSYVADIDGEFLSDLVDAIGNLDFYLVASG